MLSYQDSELLGGVIFLTDKIVGWLGVYALAGHTAQLIRDFQDVPKHCVLISNYSQQQLNQLGLKSSQIKSSNFLKTDIADIAYELDLNFGYEDLSSLRVLSGIVERVLRISGTTYLLGEYQETLVRTLENLILKDPEEENSPYVTQAIENSYKALQQCWGARSAKCSNYSLRFERASYSDSILSMPIPSGGWQRVTKSLPIKNGTVKSGFESRVFKFLSELVCCKAALLKVRVESIDASVSTLLDFGRDAEHREWFTAHEILQIAAYADVTLTDMLVASELVPVPQKLLEGVGLFSRVQKHSYSVGLIGESHAAMLMSRRRTHMHGLANHIVTPRASWLSAWDRVRCFSVAAELQKRKFQVVMYGGGCIQVACEQSKLHELVSIAAEYGLSVPMTLSKKSHGGQM